MLFETPDKLRAACRTNTFSDSTSGHASGFVQANLVILKASDARDFATFCDRNSKACPLIETLSPGDPVPKQSAPGADIRTDLPRYRVFRDGHTAGDLSNIIDIWEDDFVAFLLGCSFTAEEALGRAGLQPRHVNETGIVSMFRTNKQTIPAGKFCGPMVVSMRPYSAENAQLAAQVTKKYPLAHGAPVQIGNPAELGITNINMPDYGAPVITGAP